VWARADRAGDEAEDALERCRLALDAGSREVAIM